MKRFIFAILSCLYLFSAAGANLHFHYCMGKLESWGLGHTETKKCGGCGLEKKAAEDNGCCKDEFKHIKLKVDQKANNVVVFQFNSVGSESILTFITHPDDLGKQEIFRSKRIDNSSHRSRIATYIRNCNIRI